MTLTFTEPVDQEKEELKEKAKQRWREYEELLKKKEEYEKKINKITDTLTNRKNEFNLKVSKSPTSLISNQYEKYILFSFFFLFSLLYN